MIPMIGLLIAAYTFPRLLSLVLRDGARAEHGLVRIFAALGMIGTVLLCIGMLLTGLGTKIPTSLP